MKYLFLALMLVLTACGDDKNQDRLSVEGEYWDGVGTINGDEIQFIYVFEYPADQSIGVSFAGQGSNVYLCRYFKHQESTYVSDPVDLTIVDIYNGKFSARSEGETEDDPCKKVVITTPFVKN